MTTVFHRHGKTFAVWQAPIRSEMYAYEGRGDPKVWFAREMASFEILVFGFRTQRETLAAIDDLAAGGEL